MDWATYASINTQLKTIIKATIKIVIMKNPYANRPEYTIWSRAAASKSRLEMDFCLKPKFRISPNDAIATAGSCFAQYLSMALPKLGLQFLDMERETRTAKEPVFSARYGNIYTARQLLQIFQRCYGLRAEEDVWLTSSGSFLDPQRPTIKAEGFSTKDELFKAREIHYTAVRKVFEECRVFIFTLGLTEGWLGINSGAVIPVHPGVIRTQETAEDYVFHNFTVNEIYNDLTTFLSHLQHVNPNVKVLLTVSPVPLAATYLDRHVVTSSTYSKSVLRVAAEYMLEHYPCVDYFPSYEMVLSPSVDGISFAEDLRTVRPEVVENIMGIFARTYKSELNNSSFIVKEISDETRDREFRKLQNLSEVICDDDLIG